LFKKIKGGKDSYNYYQDVEVEIQAINSKAQVSKATQMQKKKITTIGRFTFERFQQKFYVKPSEQLKFGHLKLARMSAKF
jgi:hypothetical protein